MVHRRIVGPPLARRLLHRPVTPAQSRDRPMRRTQRNAARWKYLRRGDFPLTSAGMGPIKVRGRDDIDRWVIRGRSAWRSSFHGDDTPVPVLEPGPGRTRTGRLWVYVRRLAS